MRFVRAVLYGPAELRAGWRLLVFLCLIVITFLVMTPLLSPLRGHLNTQESRAVTRTLATLVPLLIAGAVMAKLEGRKMAYYGLPWRNTLGRQFWLGVIIGFPTMTAVVAAMHLAGVLSFTEGTPRGSVIWLYAIAYALFFIVGALFEEFLCRGYLLFTLMTGVGFWPAAVLSSLLFGILHTGNPGETLFGCFSTGVFGFLFCVMLRRTGSLWMPVGFHAAYNWGEAFFYGTPDSGMLSEQRFLTAKLSGPVWLTGGTAGPEGSCLCVAIVVLVTIAFAFWRRETKFPSPNAIRPLPSAMLAAPAVTTIADQQACDAPPAAPDRPAAVEQ
jgi:uncharacterized protein